MIPVLEYAQATLSVTSLRAPPATNQGSLGRSWWIRDDKGQNHVGWPLANWETIGKAWKSHGNMRKS